MAMPESTDFGNHFSWSKSRDSTFNECQRKYRLQYYAFWGGWSEDAPDQARRLYKLRGLSSVPSWVGIATHDTIKWLLEYIRDGGTTPPLTKVFEHIRRRIYNNWEVSSTKQYWSLHRKDPNWFGLIEHELQLPLSPVTRERAFLKAAQCLTNLYDSPLFADILASDPANWLHIDDTNYFTLDGVRVWAGPDFMYTRKDGKTDIIDWKTGKRRGTDMRQVIGYGAFARIAHNIHLEDLVATLVYLGGDAVHVDTTPITLDAIREFGLYARNSMSRMTHKLRVLPDGAADADATRAANDPLPMADFPKTDKHYKCKNCNFRGECWPHGIST